MKEEQFKNVTIVGAGYVGTSIAALIGQRVNVTIVEIDEEKVNQIKQNQSPIEDALVSQYLDSGKTKFGVTPNISDVFSKSDLYILCLPTSYDDSKNNFDTTTLENVAQQISENDKDIPILIKSTVDVGFTDRLRKQTSNQKIIFSPEFLREGNALRDNLYPSRIVFGSHSDSAREIMEFIKSFCLNDPKSFFMSSSEAESVKLFSNSFLAMRVAYFNELDTYAMNLDLNTKNIIDAVCSDPRISDGYNNPSFGYGGYCLPKDTKQLLANYSSLPQNIISAIVESNESRMDAIVANILKHDISSIGIYRLVMKKNSDNLRESSIHGILSRLKQRSISMIVYEPLIKENEYMGISICNDLERFKEKSTLIIANRKDEEIKDISHKVFTRDIFEEN